MSFVNVVEMMLVTYAAGLLLLIGSLEAAQVLFQPFAYGMSSRFRDHIRLAEILVEQGHNVTVLINNVDRMYMKQRLPVRFSEVLSQFIT